MKPMMNGAIGKPAFTNPYPSKPNSNTAQTSKIRLFKPKAPTTHKTRMIGSRMCLGTASNLMNMRRP
ncbi:hypothetical protein D3C78_1611830 [compost metagenome]